MGWLCILETKFYRDGRRFGIIFSADTGAIFHKYDATTILSVPGAAFGWLMTALALPGLFAGNGLLKTSTLDVPRVKGTRYRGGWCFRFGIEMRVEALLVLRSGSEGIVRPPFR